VGHEEFARHVLTQADCHVDGREPEVAAQSVENASYAGILACHAGQLAVGTVERVSPYEQQGTGYVDPYVVEIEAYARSHAEKDRGYGYRVGGYAEATGENGPCVAYGAVEIEVDVLLGIHRLERCLEIGSERAFTADLHIFVFLTCSVVCHCGLSLFPVLD
jgi:hypothetical protein